MFWPRSRRRLRHPRGVRQVLMKPKKKHSKRYIKTREHVFRVVVFDDRDGDAVVERMLTAWLESAGMKGFAKGSSGQTPPPCTTHSFVADVADEDGCVYREVCSACGESR